MLAQIIFHFIEQRTRIDLVEVLVIMKVLHIIKTNSGAIWAFKLIEKLVEKGFEVEVLLPEDNTGFALEYKKIGVKVYPFDAALPIRKPWELFRKAQAFKTLIKNIHPDIIHCHFVTNIMFCRIALKGVHIPRLFQVPGPLHLENIFYRTVEITSADKDDYWAGSCQKTCDIYKKAGVPTERIFFAYYASDFDEYAKESKRTGKFREELMIPNDTKLVGTVSYFYKPKKHLLQFYGIKGHEDFIDAMSIVIKENKSIRGVVIGGPAIDSEKYMQKMKKRAQKKCGNSIIFTGHRNDILNIYPDLDIAVHPSRSENYGGCGESLSKGIPTITTDVGGFPDLIKDGVTGYMVKAGAPQELAKKIIYVAEHYEEATKVAKNGQKLIVAINTDLTSNQVIRIYKEILNQLKSSRRTSYEGNFFS